VSSTGRSLVRNGLDQYDTPGWCTRLIAPIVVTRGVRAVFDPCAGVGAILDTLCAGQMFQASTGGYEIDRDRAAACAAKGHPTIHADALSLGSWGLEPGTIIVTNPPFALAEEFVRRSLSEVDTVAMLLRLSFVAGQKRSALWREHPADVFVLSRRPSFTGKGTDSCDYAWFVWGPQRGGHWSRLEAK